MTSFWRVYRRSSLESKKSNRNRTQPRTNKVHRGISWRRSHRRRCLSWRNNSRRRRWEIRGRARWTAQKHMRHRGSLWRSRSSVLSRLREDLLTLSRPMSFQGVRTRRLWRVLHQQPKTILHKAHSPTKKRTNNKLRSHKPKELLPPSSDSWLETTPKETWNSTSKVQRIWRPQERTKRNW